MQKLYVYIYCLPIPVTMIGLLVLCGVWGFVRRRCRLAGQSWQRGARGAAVLLLTAWLAAILHMTIFSRSSGSEREVYLWPFHQLWTWLSGGNKELLRAMWMNVLLFVPGGLLLTALWCRRWPRWLQFFLTTLLLTCLSCGIEAVQYGYALGVAEADDVLCNGLGALLGAGIHETAKIEETL